MTEGASPVASGRYPGYFLEYKQELWVTSSAAAEWRGMQLTRTRWSLVTDDCRPTLHLSMGF
jgi:hypothetical protein